MGSESGKTNQEARSDQSSTPVQETELISPKNVIAVVAIACLIVLVGSFPSNLLLWGVFFLLTAILVVISRHNWWPWIALLILVPVLLTGIPSSDSTAPTVTPTMGATRLIPVPSSKLQLGTGLLVHNDRIDLTVIVPVEGQRPQRYVFENLRVDQLLGDNGPVSVFQRADIKTIVLAVPADIAEELQSVLALGTSTIAYSLLPTAAPATTEITDTPLPDTGEGIVEGSPPTVTPSPVRILVTIPIGELTSGTGPLAIGEYIEIDVYGPADDDPSLTAPVSFLNLMVAGLFSDTGPVSTINWNAVREIVVEVSSEEAPLLQAALSKDNARIIYRQIQATPTATPIVDPTEPPFTDTPRLTEVSIPVDSIQSWDGSLKENETARLVVVVRSGANATSEASGTAPALRAQEFCVTVTMLPAENESVSFRLDLQDFARYAESITAQAGIFLVSDADCSIQ